MRLRTLLAMAGLAAALWGCAGPSAGDARPLEAPLPPQALALDGLGPVEAGALRLVSAAGFRARVTVETAAGERIEGSFDYAHPDRYHLAVGGAIPVEVIWLGDVTYVESGGRWQSAAPTFLAFSPLEIVAQVQAISDGEEPWVLAGADAVCDRYTIGSSGIILAEACVKDGQPLAWLRLVDGPTITRVSFTDFGAGIEIRAP
jgi:hypothetical protein